MEQKAEHKAPSSYGKNDHTKNFTTYNKLLFSTHLLQQVAGKVS